MKCSNCNKELIDNLSFCPYCGNSLALNAVVKKKKTTSAISGLVCSLIFFILAILDMLVCLVALAPFLGRNQVAQIVLGLYSIIFSLFGYGVLIVFLIVAIVLSVSASRRLSGGGGKARAMNISSILFSILTILSIIAFIAFSLSVFLPVITS